MPSTTPQDQVQQADIVEMNEAFEEVNGNYQFTSTLIVYRAGDSVYHAISKSRYSSPSEVKTDHLINNILIPVSAYSPPFSPQFTRAPNIPPDDTYVKQPRLISYDRVLQGYQSPNHIADSFLKEVEVCEVLRRHPHPNVATYLGCRVKNGRIAGICFVKYDGTLMQKFNPGSFMKRKARSTCDKTKDYSSVLEGIASGIMHLHSLRLVHNDVNPSNIMFDGDTPLIIDFESCRRVGESLEDVGRTYEWYDEKVQQSLPKDDLDALDEMRIWLGDSSKEFQFDE